ncbi:hypothetical protein FG93_00649 [Bosea sp. LC85]|uniref:hypothetical protein n=1 Tax=Bosea sp. LC85 TaxID=1502851 RepID=UPI0004E2A801|nr:hypothetical protein [Bosea sp. LC85]KFC75627.1 hypothetical protein FG93_00649 [Bosea sp. LC85]
MPQQEKLSYSEFAKHLLVQLAISTEGDTTRFATAATVARLVPGIYSRSWPLEAAKELADEGLLRINALLGDGTSVTITGRGLRAAEEYAAELHYDEIHEEIEQAQQATNPAPPAVIQLDRSADAFKALDAEMGRVIAELRGSNSLSADTPREASQRVAELEAGRKLLDAEQIDRGLAERLLLAPLRWAASKASEEVLKKGVGLALNAVASFFGFKL